YVPARQVQLREMVEVEVFRGHLRRERLLPNLLSLGCRRHGEVDDEAEPSHERRVERALHVRREYGETAERLHALEQVVDLDVRVAVVAVLNFRALAEDEIGRAHV